MQTLKLSGARASDIALAGEILRSGGVVAIPTETVYGLAANAFDSVAVARIFAAKGRPGDNPLIVHICNLSQIEELCRDIPPQAYALARAFWPGPLTLVLKKTAAVPGEVTAGLDTVAVRMPAHKTALAVIAAAGVPLAAPSANISGRPSPTNATHVLNDFNGKINAVLGGAPCRVGVESTVLDITCSPPAILRPGAVTREALSAVAGEVAEIHGDLRAGETPRSPGLKYRHYATKAPLTLLTGAPDDIARALPGQVGEHPLPAVICFEEYLPEMKQRFGRRVYSLGQSWDCSEHSRRLFGILRRIDGTSAASVIVQAPRRFGRGQAVFNRLWRACGGRLVECTGRAVIGVTGASGSGKSSLSRMFSALGAAVFDADAIYKRLLRENAEMRGGIMARFPAATGRDGQIDIAALRREALANAYALTELSQITHPFVGRELRRLVEGERSSVCVLDVPVLFGSGIDRMCTATVGVLAPRPELEARIAMRDGLSMEGARARLDAQGNDTFFRSHCDIIIENANGEADFLANAERIFNEISKNF